jgi:hypothetical protein
MGMMHSLDAYLVNIPHASSYCCYMPQLEARETRDLASELKFAVDAPTAARIREWARARLASDPYAGGPGEDYQTTTVYYDTQDLAVYHRRGSYGRSKFRIRRYNASDMAFLERKLRTSGVLSKRRTIVPVDDLVRLGAPTSDPDWHAYWFHQRVIMRKVHPVCQVSYRRMARVAMTDYGPIRLTLDVELMAQPVSGPAFVSGPGTPMRAGRQILEMKFRVEMPAVFRQLTEAFALRPERLSKYRLAVEALGRAEVRSTVRGQKAGAPRA